MNGSDITLQKMVYEVAYYDIKYLNKFPNHPLIDSD